MGAGGGTFGQTNPPERGSLFVISTGTVVAILLVLLVSPIHFTLSDYELRELSFHHKIALRWPTFADYMEILQFKGRANVVALVEQDHKLKTQRSSFYDNYKMNLEFSKAIL